MPMELWRFCRDLWDSTFPAGWWLLDRGPLYGWVWLGDLQIGHCTTRSGGERRRFCWVQDANYHESGGNGERERETERWAYNSIYSIIANVTLSWTSLSGLSLGTRSFEHGAAAQGEACLKVWQNWVRYPSDLMQARNNFLYDGIMMVNMWEFRNYQHISKFYLDWKAICFPEQPRPQKWNRCSSVLLHCICAASRQC